MKSPVGPLAAALTFALALVGCTASTPDSNGGQQATGVETVVPAGFEKYYKQGIDWGQCQAEDLVMPLLPTPKDLSDYQCATVQAPMNWDDPTSEPIELSLARHLGDKGEKSPALFYNLGGPGGGAVDSITSVVSGILTKQLAEHFQIVALDPRGVGGSSPIVCMTDQERDEDIDTVIDTSNMTTDELVALADQEMAELGAKCLERSGEILGYVDTDSAARDFDLARALMGLEKFDYLGFSYGTVLGAQYAELFPENVGRMVLDGAVDPGLSINELSAAQIEGMEKSLYHWIEECQAGPACPLDGDLEDGKEELTNFLKSVEAEPLKTSDPDRDLNVNQAYTAIVGSLYSTDIYPQLTLGISQAFKGDGTTLLFLADYFNSRGGDGVYWDNSSDAFMAINALDYEPVGTQEEWQAQADDLAERFPVLAADFGLASAGLSAWPVESRVTRHTITAPGSPEILVIGTTNDPATPYFMSENLANDLENGVLVTVEGWDHTAYSQDASACVISAVDNFLIKGKVPEDGLVCD